MPRLHSSFIFLAIGAAASSGCTPSHEPTAVFENGKITEIRNCSPPSEAEKLACLRLVCEKTLYERSLLPTGTRVVQWTQSNNFSDDPARSTHMAKYAYESTFRYAACEMTGLEVVSANEVIPKLQQ